MKNNDQGFSLMESLIAIFILGVIMAGSIAFFSNANTLYYHGVHAQVATWLADSELEQIKNSGCGNTASNAGSSVTITTNITGTLKITWPSPATQDPCSVATTTKPACSPAPIPVGVCVTWAEPGANNSHVGLVTYIGS